MTNEQLDALEAAANAATSGPWKCPGRALVVSQMDSSERLICDCLSKQFAQAPKDATFIAAANPAVALELIAELRQTRKERDWLAEKLESNTFCSLPDNEECGCSFCSDCEYGTYEGWLNAAKEATSCQKN